MGSIESESTREPARRFRARRSLALLLGVAALAGCGGGNGGDDEALNPFDGVETETGETTTGTAGAEPTSLDESALPPPGQARVEVDGNVYTLEASGSIHFDCRVTDDEIRINFQQTESGDLAIQGSTLTGEWGGNVTFAEEDDNYGGSISADRLALGPEGMVYTGTLTHRTYSDPANTRDVEATIAVNCGAAGPGGAGDATVEVDGRTLVFPASGAQSFECEVSDTSFRVVVNRLALEDSQIQMEGSVQPDGAWLAGVYVIAGDDRYDAIVPADGTGLVITGSTLTYTGAFTHKTDPETVEREVSGTASVTCP